MRVRFILWPWGRAASFRIIYIWSNGSIGKIITILSCVMLWFIIYPTTFLRQERLIWRDISSDIRMCVFTLRSNQLITNQALNLTGLFNFADVVNVPLELLKVWEWCFIFFFDLRFDIKVVNKASRLSCSCILFV